MSILDDLAVMLAAQRPVTDDTPPGAVVHGTDMASGPVFWASCHRCCWWASDGGPVGDDGFRTEAVATAEAAHHNAITTVHRMKGNRTP